MTLAEINIKATEKQILDTLRQIYSDSIEENADDEQTRPSRIFSKLSGSDLDIDEFCAGGEYPYYRDADSFSVENGIILWYDEEGEKYELNDVLGYTPKEVADEAYDEVLDAYEWSKGPEHYYGTENYR